MDPNKNQIPPNVKTIHLIAVCGTGMGALAVMLKDLGYQVTGSDQHVYPPMSTFLRDHGILLREGFDPSHLDAHPDLVIVGNAVTRDNPQALRVAEAGLFYCSMPQAVNHFVTTDKKTLIVTGTHGKTTTSSILAWLLYSAGLDPSFLIGGILQNFNSNHRLGNGDYIVIEGDEYDTAFFDKGPKFLHYRPQAAIITGIEFDHADIFNDLNHVLSAFSRFLDGLPEACRLYAFDGNNNAMRLLKDRPVAVQTYGFQADSTWRLGKTRFDNDWTAFEIFKENMSYGWYRTQMAGHHNLLNTLAAVAIADQLGTAPDTIADALTSFTGIRRRQEIRGIKNSITVIDDFAHHPTAVVETISAIRGRYPKNRLIAVFEPRTHTSMRKVFQKTYTRAFDLADIICIRSPSMLHKVPQNQQLSSQKLVDDLILRKKEARHFSRTGKIIDYIVTTATPGDVILIMSNGGFDNIHERLLERL